MRIIKISCYAALIVVLMNATAFAQNRSKQPNIIIILADDLSWADLGCYGSTFYETPVLDQLSKQGVRFTNAYTTSPVCSPTRASILTGKYPIKTGVTDWIKGRQEGGKAKPFEKMIAQPTAYELALYEKTFAEYAIEKGYATMIAGKWHLGEAEKFWPESQGFQVNKGGWSSGGPGKKVNDTTGGFFSPYGNPRLSDGPEGEYITDRLTDESLQFIEANKDKPFLLYYSMYAVHNPMQAPTALVEKYKVKQKLLHLSDKVRFIKNEPWMKHQNDWKKRMVQDHPVYAAMVENMDTNIGRLLNKLKALNIDDNTLVIFTSDNGGLSTAEGSPTTNGKLRGGKGWLYEGGIRVPLIMYWKGKVMAGTTNDLPVNSNDIFATVAKVLGTRLNDQTVDGQDVFSLMKKPSKSSQRTLFWYYPHYSNQGGRPGVAMREGKYKMIYYFDDQSVELFDISTDVSEEENISINHPQLTAKLQRKIMQWLKNNHAKLPETNPAYKSN